MNRAVFADTAYFIALVDADDDAHPLAVQFAKGQRQPIVTTQWVLTEVANSFSTQVDRPLFLFILNTLLHDPTANIVSANHALFDAGVRLFSERPDKEWSLTDCISMHVMQDRNIIDVLTTDHHFTQAGFNVLLKV